MSIENVDAEEAGLASINLNKSRSDIPLQTSGVISTKAVMNAMDEDLIYADDTCEKVYSRLHIYKDRPDICMQLYNKQEDEKPYKEVIIPKADVRKILEYLYR